MKFHEYWDRENKLLELSYKESIRHDSLNIDAYIHITSPIRRLVDLLNFLRPENDKIQRDKIFTSEKNYMMKLKPDGLEYLKQKANGYISFYRGNIPYTFAKRVDKGKISDGLLFTPVIKCYMKEFQDTVYLKTKENIDDTLDRTSSAAANFVFPGLFND